jgi:hypothetical protein
MDKLLWELNDNDYYTEGYADDISILINGKFPQIVSEVLQTSLCIVLQWCDRIKLSISPNKMVIIPFTRKRDIRGLMKPTLFNNTIQLPNEVKYLGLTLDKRLTWKKQLAKVTNKAYRAFWTCRGTFGNETKGDVLDLHHGCKTTVWWPRVNLKTNKVKRSKLKRWPAWALLQQRKQLQQLQFRSSLDSSHCT